jgi:UDP-N-acetylmuramoyl-tripeptide--D-alanyl-D-alanine ligase
MRSQSKKCKAGIEQFHPVAGRMAVFEGQHGAMIIDDTYNASPRSAEAAITMMAELPGRKILVLGSMNELGDISAAEHRQVGVAAAALKPAWVVTIGEQANRYTAAGAVEHGLATSKIRSFDSPYEAGKFLHEIVKKGDVVLAKGSQNGVFAEEALANILAHAEDRSRLVRQDAVWQRRKREQFGVQSI